jgi:hypothetical protein
MDSGRGSAALGPRLLGRLTAELIHRSPQYMNCVLNYEIDLRGERPDSSCRDPTPLQGSRRRRPAAACAAPSPSALHHSRLPAPLATPARAGNKIGAIENLGATEVCGQQQHSAPGRPQPPRARAPLLGTTAGRGCRPRQRRAAARAAAKQHAPCALPSAPMLTRARAHRIPQNQFDCIDLSDNAVVRLEGFPRLPRLKVLYLNNNRVSKVARNLQGEAAAARDRRESGGALGARQRQPPQRPALAPVGRGRGAQAAWARL